MNAWIMPVATLILCVAIPYVVNLCKKAEWSANTKRWLAFAFSAIAGIATALLSGLPTPETLVTWVLAVIGGVQLAYAAFKAIGVTSGWLDALEGVGSEAQKQQNTKK